MVSDDERRSDTAEGSDTSEGVAADADRPTAADADADTGSEQWEPDGPTRVGEDTIVVPMRMYKGITVFSTLLAVLLIVLGFFMFDAATQPQNLIRRVVVWAFETVGVAPPAGVFDVGFGLLGVALILVGAGSYILGSRFKTSGMLGDDERPDDESVEE